MEWLNFEHIEGIISVTKNKEAVQKQYDLEFTALITKQHKEIDALRARYEVAFGNTHESKHQDIEDQFLEKQKSVRTETLGQIEELNRKYEALVAVEKKKLQVLSDLNKNKANDNSKDMSR